MTHPDYAALAAAAEVRGWAAAVEEAGGPGTAYRLRTADHRAAPSLVALPAANASVLDVRCGLGTHVFALASVCRTTAADPDPNALRLLRARLREESAGSPAAGIDILDADPLEACPPESVDLLVARSRDLPRLRNLAKLVAPGGRITLGAPNPWSFLKRRCDGPGIGPGRAADFLAPYGFRLADVYGAWRSLDDVRALFHLDRRSRKRAARCLGLPGRFIRLWIPAYWITWERIR